MTTNPAILTVDDDPAVSRAVAPNRSVRGTGLGLDISYRIVVNKHPGDIRVTSRPGDTRFRVLLPINPEAD